MVPFSSNVAIAIAQCESALRGSGWGDILALFVYYYMRHPEFRLIDRTKPIFMYMTLQLLMQIWKHGLKYERHGL